MKHQPLAQDPQTLIDLSIQRALIDESPTLNSLSPFIRKCIEQDYSLKLISQTCGMTRVTLNSILQRTAP
ncbi:hypothetical protein [Moritella sp.]|uniref:hypothetical protein n=1 Tax=Moritella sp. TaxID=78556 RepID=UPI001DE05C8D|nr:hypothetical protein [Moritella sp.]MCJ8349002.1 hypothetical protein [Moritella sp.]NQZ41377.1 hypothetical protein [Moritella sp.]